MPFCPGCGHGPSVKYLSKALQEIGYDPLDVIIVSDIGCSGLVDPLFNTHTVHGLHGRSPALAMGITMGLKNKSKKVIAVQGDGGATIGLQHLMEASRRNLNMTMLVLNNLIYGMTGGQVSGLSTSEFKYDKTIPDTAPPFDVCQLAHQAGAAFASRVNNPKDIVGRLVEALRSPGFSLVEISSLCQPYGAKKIDQLQEWARPEISLRNSRDRTIVDIRETKSLFGTAQVLQPMFDSTLEHRLGILIAGSAGGGVQSAAQHLARAGILSGLSSTMKGEYPITVGTGFSVAEVILSKDEINYTGLEKPDIIIVVSEDGYRKIKPRIHDEATLFFDEKVAFDTNLKVQKRDFIGPSGKKGAALAAIAGWLEESKLIPLDAIRASVAQHKLADQLLEIIDNAVIQAT